MGYGDHSDLHDHDERGYWYGRSDGQEPPPEIRERMQREHGDSWKKPLRLQVPEALEPLATQRLDATLDTKSRDAASREGVYRPDDSRPKVWAVKVTSKVGPIELVCYYLFWSKDDADNAAAMEIKEGKTALVFQHVVFENFGQWYNS